LKLKFILAIRSDPENGNFFHWAKMNGNNFIGFHLYSWYFILVEEQGEFTEQRHRGFGRCYTFHPLKKYRDLGIYYYKIQM